MKNIILFILIITLSTSLLGQHSLGAEIGYNLISGSSLSGESAPFFAIPYEYNWDENSSFILKPSFSQNRDYFIGSKEYDVYDFRTKLNFFRLSFSLERKFGNPEKKFFGTYRIGLGYSIILGGSYQQSQANILSPIPSTGYTKKVVSNSEINLFSNEMFTEFGIGIGYKYNKNWSVHILRNSIIGLMNIDNLGEPILNPLKQYNFIEEIRYRSFITGINFKCVYHFNSKKE